MFLKLEGDIAVNIELVEKVEFFHSRQQASLWAGGIIILSDSRMAYKYFADETIDGLYVPAREEKKAE